MRRKLGFARRQLNDLGSKIVFGFGDFGLTSVSAGGLNTVMSKEFQISRRSFFRSCAMTAAATGLPLWFVEREMAAAAAESAVKPLGANDKPGLALIGCGGQGSGDLQAASKFGRVVAL